MDVSTLIAALDLVGIFVFAVTGAIAGQRRGADVFGSLVLAFVTATAGGLLRDLILDMPPVAFAGWLPLAVSVVAGLLTFFLPWLLDRLHHAVQLFDALGLGLFAATGAVMGLDHGLDPVMAAVLGMISGIGGGVLRDVLTGEIPMVLRAQIYALAALAGAAVVVAGVSLGAPQPVMILVGTGLCVALRVTAIYRDWNLPRADRNQRR